MAHRAPTTSRRIRATVRAVVLAMLFVFAATATAHAGVLARPMFGANEVLVGEWGYTQPYEVKLGADPGQPVLVYFDTGPGTSLEPIAPLRFTSSDWDTWKSVDVHAGADDVYEPQHTVNILHQARWEGSGVAITPTWEASVPVLIDDEEYPGIQVNPEFPAVQAQEGDAIRWDVRLWSRPEYPVTITFDTDPALATLLTTSLTIQPDDWNKPNWVDAVIHEDDVYEGSGNVFSLTLDVVGTTSGDAWYHNRSASPGFMDYVDDDQLGLDVDPPAPGLVHATEAGPDGSFRLRLRSEPTDDVRVTLAPLNSGVITVAPTLVTFTPGNWDQWQTIDVVAVNDSTPETTPMLEQVLFTFESDTDSWYDGLMPPDVDVSVTDDDSPAILFTPPSSMSMSESDTTGTERELRMRLATAPPGTVTVTAVNSPQLLFANSPTLTFGPGDWNTVKSIRVRAFDDDRAELDPHPGIVSFTVVASGTSNPYAGQSIPTQTFQIADDDAVNASITCAGASSWTRNAGGDVELAEDPAQANHSLGCSLQLGTPATYDTTVNIVTSGGQLAVDTPSVTFAPGQQGPVPITFTATNDQRAEPPSINSQSVSFSVVTLDPVYATRVPSPIAFAVIDDDRAGLDITPPGPHAVTEGGGEVQLGIRLTSEPANAVSISLDPGSRLRIIEPTGGTLGFNGGNWSQVQYVRVEAVDDDRALGGAQAPLALQLTSGDALYQPLAPPPIPFDVTDNDRAGVVVIASGADTSLREDGAADTFQVRLSSRPGGTVRITPATDGQVTVSPTSLEFTDQNWADPQVFTVTPRQDDVFEGVAVSPVRLELASSDTAYDAAGPNPTPIVDVPVTDDEQGGLAVVESDALTSVTEAGATDTITIALNAKPSADVTIRPDGAGQAVANPAAVTFTADTWNVAQTITIAAMQDDADEADPHVIDMKLVPETGALGWSTVTGQSVSVKVADDDKAGLVLVETDGATAIAEGSRSDSATIRLSSRPATAVTITPTADPQLNGAAAKPFTIEPGAWNLPVAFDIVAVDDKDEEGDHTGTYSWKVTGGDPQYQNAAASLTAKITDNDDGNLTITPGEDTGETAEEDVDDRTPREQGGDTDGGGGGGSSKTDEGSTSIDTGRTDEGDTRTDAGSERTDDGLGLGTIGAGGDGKDEEEAPELQDEVVSATEPAPKRAKPDRPNAVQRAVRKATRWVKDNQETVATVGGVGLMATGAGTFLLRGDPVKVAQRGLTALDRAPKVPGDGGHKPHPRVQRDKNKRGGKKKRRGDDDEPEAEVDAAGVDTDS